MLAIVLCVAGCRTAHNTDTVTPTRDAATAYMNGTITGSMMTVGGLGSNSMNGSPTPVQPITVCDKNAMWDAPKVGANDDFVTITGVGSGLLFLRVCSYAIMNGPTAQDVQFYAGGSTVSSGNGKSCGLSRTDQPFMTYHLGPYESITRGVGVGALYGLAVNKGICVHRLQNGTSPLSIELTYAIY